MKNHQLAALIESTYTVLVAFVAFVYVTLKFPDASTVMTMFLTFVFIIIVHTTAFFYRKVAEKQYKKLEDEA